MAVPDEECRHADTHCLRLEQNLESRRLDRVTVVAKQGFGVEPREDGIVTAARSLRVGEGETGRVIGREGKVANAMRVLVRIAGEKTGERRANLEIV